MTYQWPGLSKITSIFELKLKGVNSLLINAVIVSKSLWEFVLGFNGAEPDKAPHW